MGSPTSVAVRGVARSAVDLDGPAVAPGAQHEEWPLKRAAVADAESHERARVARRGWALLHPLEPFAQPGAVEPLRTRHRVADEPAHVVGGGTDRSGRRAR